MSPAPAPGHQQPLPRTLLGLAGGIALIEVMLSLADYGMDRRPDAAEPGVHGRRLLVAACSTATRRSSRRSR